MMKFRLILIFGLLLVSLDALYAQTQKVIVSGRVKDENGVYIIGATVAIKGTRTGVVTDYDGVYTIGLDPGQTLVFSFIGMEPQEHKVTKATKKLDITLKYKAESLEELVVVGYGSGKKVGTTIGSAIKVSGKELAQSPSANVMDALQGKVAGLTINATSGKPGSAPMVLLHGIGTLNDVNNTGDRAVQSTPLYVVDGLPVSNELVNTLSPDDFESVTVLKDASATSIYGARAAYGVIYITTKKGRFETAPQVTISSQVGVSQVASRKFYKNLLSPKEYVGFFVEMGELDQTQGEALLKQFPHHTHWDKIYNKDNSLTTQTNVSVAGGGKNVSYYFSGGYFNQGGVREGSDYKRYSLRSNIDSHITDWLSVGLGLSLSNTYNENNGTLPGDYGGVLALPFYTPYDENGQKVDYVETLYGTRFYLPHYQTSKILSNSRNTDVVPNLYVIVKPLKGLTYKAQGGLQYNVSINENKTLASYEPAAGEGNTSRSMGEGIYKTLTNTLEYKFGLGEDHQFTALLGQEMISNDYRGFNAASSGQEIDQLSMLIHGSKNIRARDGRGVSTYNSIFSRLEYSYKSRYYADFSWRRDGSSSFGKNNRYANFWSAGLMWNAKHEAFLYNEDWLDQLRFKVSAGTSGSRGGAGDYGSYSVLDISRYNGQSAFHLGTLGNPDLRWEQQSKTTLGMTLGMFNKITLEVDLYERRIKDMFFTQTLPLMSGFTTYPTNLAKMQNQGADVTLSVIAYQDNSKEAHITPYINFNYNRQKVLELAYGSQQIPQNAFGTGYEVGSPLNLFAPIFKGVNPDTGYPEWYLPGEDRMQTTTDDSKVTSNFDETELIQNTGKLAFAPWNGGFGLNAAYKGLSLQVAFSFSAGRYQINRDREYVENTSFGTYNKSKEALDYWKTPGQIARNPRKEVQFIQNDSRLIEDASFIRLKNINLGYALPEDLVKKIPFCKGLRFYGSARNLLTFTKFTGADPEFDITLGNGGYPNTREYTFGMELRF